MAEESNEYVLRVPSSEAERFRSLQREQPDLCGGRVSVIERRALTGGVDPFVDVMIVATPALIYAVKDIVIAIIESRSGDGKRKSVRKVTLDGKEQELTVDNVEEQLTKGDED